ncbi:CaiB/BaiF CoA transferase family protein [Candidatus Poriferisodalis sp.]|uniref:CaiB/BaiF CoA transferase family protein n=1 Tax=Candidatus Poriferisodalis sp. TaxID=3101277 RepID=UPI003B5A3659
MTAVESGAPQGPLAGIRVVEIATFIAAPGGAHLLASQGADVIKVEDLVVGDPLRMFGSSRGGMSGWFANLNAGKRSLAMDIASPEGRELMADLLATADVFVQAYRPGVAERLGIGEADVRKRNPEVIYVSISGFGRDGPYSKRPAYDAVIQGWSGIAAVQGGDGEPQFVKSFIPDKVTSLTWTQAVCAALFARERTGRGEHVELSLLDSAVSFMWPDAMMDHTVLADDADHRPNVLAGYRLLACRDGYVAVMPLTDAHWKGVADAFDRPDLLTDPRFAEAGPRAAHFAEMLDTLGEVVADVARDDVVDWLVAADVPVAPALRPEEVAADPQVQHTGVVREVDHPIVGRIRQHRPAALFAGDTPELGPAVERGADTDQILAELGKTSDAIAELRAAGVVR